MDSSTEKQTSPSSSLNSTVGERSTFNSFFWYFFQTLTISSILLMVLSIYCAFASGNNIRVILIITVAFAIICPSLIIPKLPEIAAASFPIIKLQTDFHIQVLHKFLWTGGFKYPFLMYFSCSSLMAVVGLLKLYGDHEGPVFERVVYVIFANALQFFVLTFGYLERYDSYATKWVKSGTGAALLGVIIMGVLAHYLPPLMEPEKKMMNATATVSIPHEKKMNMAEAAISGIRKKETSEGE